MSNDELAASQTSAEPRSVLARIASVYPSLSEAERKVADVIRSDPASARGLAVTRIASMAQVSQGTVVRFCRTLGFEGYTDFKLALAEDLSPHRASSGREDVSGDGDERGDSRPKVIGCIGPVYDAEIMVRVCTGVGHACRKQGFHVVTADSRYGLDIECDRYEIERHRVKSLVDAGCQAIVLNPTTRTREQLAQDYLKTEYLDFPIVLVDIAYPEQMRSQVVLDNYQAGWDVTRALVDHGHRRIAFMLVEGDPDDYMHRSTQDRYRGYLDAMASVGLKPRDEDLWLVDGTEFARPARYLRTLQPKRAGLVAKVEPLVRRELSRSDRATAVIVAIGDTTAAAVINIARQCGLTVPDELQVFGFDNLEISSLYYPPFPTCAPDFVRVGELAAEMALEEIRTGRREYGILSYMLPVPIRLRGMSINAAEAAEASCELESGLRI